MDDKQLYASVRAGFISQHTSLNKWCKTHGIHRQNARDALLGIWAGDTGLALRSKLIAESGIEVGNSTEQVTNFSCQLDLLVGNSQLHDK